MIRSSARNRTTICWQSSRRRTRSAASWRRDTGFSSPGAGDRTAGFLAFYPRGGSLYLSKLYLYREERGRGYGREMVDFALAQAREAGLDGVELNVNRFNPTVEVYERMGFRRIRSEKIDIGGGFYMDDYVYRLDA